jgi:hypothetical protein
MERIHKHFGKTDNQIYMSSFSGKSDFGNERSADDEYLYKQYKINLPNAKLEKTNVSVSKKPESDNFFEITIPVK